MRLNQTHKNDKIGKGEKMTRKRLKPRYISICVLMVGLAIGFGWQTNTVHARISLSGLQAQITELQQEDVDTANQLIIENVVATESTLDIDGVNFGGSPVVTIGAAGEYTVTVDSSTGTAINATVSPPLVPGTYLLIVAAIAAPTRSQFDAMDFTVGAVGPEGPKGEPGPMGHRPPW